MIEITEPNSLTITGPAPADTALATQTPQAVSLTGELVDSKCYLGVMRPGVGKVHRGCAVRCLAGGVPPALLVRGGDGFSQVFLLAGPDGAPLAYDVQLAARTLTVRGDLVLTGGTPVIHVVSMEVK
jgi:hypothetical protein